MAWWTSRRALLAGAGGAGAAAALGGCANARVIGFDKANKSLDIANSSEPLSLDPHKCTGSWENNIVGNMFVGLTTENERAEPVPGMAERWITSEDGLTWTFYLRRATWSDGEFCDAHDFQFGFRRIMTPARRTGATAFSRPWRRSRSMRRRCSSCSSTGCPRSRV